MVVIKRYQDLKQRLIERSTREPFTEEQIDGFRERLDKAMEEFGGQYPKPRWLRPESHCYADARGD